MNKRGSHVEVIISFIIFVTFIVFLFATIKSPITRDESKKNIFDGIELGLMNKISSDMTTVTVNLGSGTGNCVSLDNFLGDSGVGRNIIVKDYSSTTIPSYINGNSLEINKGSTGNTLFKVYYSGEFPELETGSGCSQASYKLGFTKTKKYVFEDKFLELMNENYQTVKTELNVANGTNFTYGMILSNGTTIERAQGEILTNVYVRDTPIEYVDLDGNIMEGYLKTTIW